jgi:hypothetical protein
MDAYAEMLKKYGATVDGTAQVDYEKQQKLIREFAVKISPDVKELYNKTLGDLARYTTITNEGRHSISGVSSVTLAVSVDTGKMTPVVVEFIDGMPAVLKKYKADLATLCTEFAVASKEECTESKIEEGLNETWNADDKKEFEKEFNEMFNYVEFKDLKFFINPVDNTMMRSEGKLVVKSEGLKEMESPEMKVSKLEFVMNTYETSRGKDIDVQAPKDFTDLTKLIEDTMKSLQETMQSTQSELDTQERMMQDLLKTQPTEMDYDYFDEI